jgi:hypothetical protein
LFEVEIAVRESVDVWTPPPPLDAIRKRASEMSAHSAARFRLLAVAALALSLAGLGVAVAEHPASTVGPPPPVASTTPAPSMT